MLDLNLLAGPLQVVENPGLDTLDPRFQEIVAIVETGDFAKIGAQAEALLRDNIFDIRVIHYYLYAVFVEQGLSSLERLFSCLTKIFQENWDAVGPTTKKEKLTQRSLNWFLTKLMETLLYHQTKTDEVWQKWLQETAADQVQLILDGSKGFQNILGLRMEDAANQEQLVKLGAWLKDLYKLIYVPPAESPAPREPSATQEAPSSEQPKSASATEIPGMSMEVSYPLQMLLKKLEAFDSLVQKGDLAKAAIIADDINTIMTSFDPRLYFPKIFANYYKRLSTSVEAISNFWAQKESLPYQTLVQFYNVDLDGFVNS